MSAPGSPVEVREVWKAFEQKPVLCGVSFALAKGTTLALTPRGKVRLQSLVRSPVPLLELQGQPPPRRSR